MNHLSTLRTPPGVRITDATITEAFGLQALRAQIVWTKRTLLDFMKWRDTWAQFGFLRAHSETDIEIHRARIAVGSHEIDVQMHDFGPVRGLLIEPRAARRDFVEQFAI